MIPSCTASSSLTLKYSETSFGTELLFLGQPLKGPTQPPPFSMPLKLLILHGEVKSECFTIRFVPESTFNYL